MLIFICAEAAILFSGKKIFFFQNLQAHIFSYDSFSRPPQIKWSVPYLILQAHIFPKILLAPSRNQMVRPLYG
jgi:hypothetical protein